MILLQCHLIVEDVIMTLYDKLKNVDDVIFIDSGLYGLSSILVYNTKQIYFKL